MVAKADPNALYILEGGGNDIVETWERAERPRSNWD